MIISRTTSPTKHEALVRSLRADLASQVDKLMRKQGLRKEDLKEKSRLPPDNVGELLLGRKTGGTMTVRALERLASALDCTVKIMSIAVPVEEWDKGTTTIEELFRVHARIFLVEKQPDALSQEGRHR